MLNNRLKNWSQNHNLEDLLIKTPNSHPYDIKITPTIVINICSNKAVSDKRNLVPLALILELITGQKGLLTKAKYSLATFRLKKGMEIGVKITLKKTNMWNFLDKFIHIIFPSLVYFSRPNKISYDRNGNLAIGLEDINIFPEIDWLRESQHPLALQPSVAITGADLLIIWNAAEQLNKSTITNSKDNIEIYSSGSWIKCQSSSLQLFTA